MTDGFSVEANLAFVVRGEVRALDQFARAVQAELEGLSGEVRLVFKTASASRLWISEDPPREGGG